MGGIGFNSGTLKNKKGGFLKAAGSKLGRVALAVCLATTLMPNVALAEDSSQGAQTLKVSASSETPIEVKSEGEPQAGPVQTGKLEMEPMTYNIERDFEQSIQVEVKNISSEAVEFYIKDANPYEDLSMGFVSTGSEDSPAVLAAGESTKVTLSVFAQNAERTSYAIPLSAYVIENGQAVEDAKNNIWLACDLPGLDVTWTKGSSNEYTLAQSFILKNEGDYISDLTVALSGKLAEYARLDPVVSNAQLEASEELSVTIVPDLAKMSNDGVTKLEGALAASSAGSESTSQVVIDTEGKEIHVGTLASVALSKNGNQFTDFQVIEDTAKIQYADETGFHDFTSSTTASDILGQDDLFDLAFSTDVNVGNDAPESLSVVVKSRQVTVGESVPDGVVVESAEGTGTAFKMSFVLSSEEYQAYIAALQNGGANAPVLSARDADGEDGSYAVDVIFTTNDVLEVAGAGGSEALGYVGDLYEAAQFAGTLQNVYDVSTDPTIDDQTKLEYQAASLVEGLLFTGGIAVSAVNPVVGIAFSIMTMPLNDLVDDWQGAILSCAGKSAMYIGVEGYQCTNRGEIDTSFYAPEFDNAAEDNPRMYATSRMYGEGYVDDEDTNYQVRLNGLEVGSAHNAGVTDLAITEIPTDTLRTGEQNVLTFDYDTSPGHYFISTDTEITILYPSNTPVGYVGSADDYPEIRPLPDFCVYPENAFAPTDPIIGEQTDMNVKVYNRGARGGWFTVTVSSGDAEVYKEENVYLDAFSGKTVTFKWSPQAPSTDFTVQLENASVNLEEKSGENNAATTTVAARTRMVPTIGGTDFGTIIANQPISEVITIENSADVTGVSFEVDGTALPEPKAAEGANGTLDAILQIPDGLSEGEHELTTTVAYMTSEGEITLATSSNFDVLQAQEKVFRLAEDISNPTVALYRDAMPIDGAVRASQDGAYAISKTADMIDSPEDYTIVVTHDNGVLTASIDGTDETLSTDGCRTLTVEAGDGASLPSVMVTSVRSKEGDYIYVSRTWQAVEELRMSPGVYDLYIEGAVEGTGFNSNTTVDLQDSDQTINVANLAVAYGFDMQSVDNSAQFDATLFYRYGSSSGWNQYTLVANFDPSTMKLLCVSPTSWASTALEDCYDAQLVVKSNNAVFYIPLKTDGTSADSIPAALNAESLNKVDLVCSDEAWEIGSVNVQKDGIVSSLTESTIYLPDGQYGFNTTIFSENQTLASTMSAEVTDDCTLKVDETLSQYREVTIAWPGVYSPTATVQATGPSGNGITRTGFVSGSGFNAEDGQNRFTFELGCSNAYFTIVRNYEVGEGQHDIQLGGAFNGTADFPSYGEYYAGGTAVAELSSLVDEHGNELANAYAEYGSALNGTVTFTDVDDKTKAIRMPLSAESFGWFRVPLPEVAGTYDVSFEFELDQNAYFHTVSFDSHGGSEIADASVAHGYLVEEPDSPQREGYIFGGWYADAACTEKWDFEKNTVDSNVVLHAMWIAEEEAVTVTFESNGGTPVASCSVAKGQTASKPGDPQREGYTFVGWYSDKELTQEFDFSQAVNEDLALYAKWSKNANEDLPEPPSVNDGDNPAIDGKEHAIEIPAETTGGSVSVDNAKANAGDAIVIAVTPAAGKEVRFVTVVDENGEAVQVTLNSDGTYGFTMPDSKVSIAVGFGCDGGDLCVANRFTDMDTAQWYHDAVDWAVENGVMHGIGGTTLFAPDEGLAREQAATVMWNLLGEGDVGASSATQADVDQSQWYAPYVNWAVANGVMDGYSPDDFGVGDVLTREQFAATIAKAVNADVASIDLGELEGFGDKASVSDWAMQTMAWAVKNGVINGVEHEDGSRELQATRTITRAEMATMIMNAVESGVVVPR